MRLFFFRFKVMFFLFPLLSIWVSDTFGRGKTANSIDTISLNLAFECCSCRMDFSDGKEILQFSFCYDGHEQGLGFPVFVELDFKNFLNSYNKPIYWLIRDVYEAPENRMKVIDDISKMITDKNMVSFYDRKFKRHYNRKMKKIHHDLANFDGKFYYGLFKVKLIRKSIGNTPKTLPALKFSNKSQYILRKEVPSYLIVDILSIEPITKDEYLEGGR